MAQQSPGTENKATGDTLTAVEFNGLVDVVGANATDAQSRLSALEAIGLTGLTAAEVAQLANIGLATISAQQWGWLGGLDQALNTGAAVQFATVNTRNIAADGAKLDGIEAGATADQTAQEIAAAIDADPVAETALKAALAVPEAPADIGAATAAEGALAASALQPGDAAGSLAAEPVTSVSGDITLVPADARRFIKMTGAGAQTITVDAASLAASEHVSFVKTGAGTFSVVAGTGSPVLVNATSGALTAIAQGAAISIKATDVAGEYIIIGKGGPA